MAVREAEMASADLMQKKSPSFEGLSRFSKRLYRFRKEGQFLKESLNHNEETVTTVPNAISSESDQPFESEKQVYMACKYIEGLK